jgi:hypothetical protein
LERCSGFGDVLPCANHRSMVQEAGARAVQPKTSGVLINCPTDVGQECSKYQGEIQQVASIPLVQAAGAYGPGSQIEYPVKTFLNWN